MTTKRFTINTENSDTVTCYMDSIGCVYTVQLLLELTSAPDSKKILTAIDKISAKFPILKCQFVPSFWRDSWIENVDYSPDKLFEEVNLNKQDSCYYEEFYKRAAEKLDPKTGFPLKIIIYRIASRCLLVIRMHHSLSDGNGCLQLASEFGKILFGNGFSEQVVSMNRSFGQLLKSFSFKEFPALFKEAVKDNLRPLRIPFLKPIGPNQSKSSTAAQAFCERLEIQGLDYEFIKSVSKEHDLTINDYLICSFLKTAVDVRNKFDVKSYLSAVLFTIDLRRYQKERPITLANYSSAGACIARSKDTLSFPEAADTVRSTIGSLKTCYPGVGFMWLAILSEFFRLPSGINRWIASLWIGGIKAFASRCFVFSNVGGMDNYLDSFGVNLKKASFLGPFSTLPMPVFWISGFQSTLTININQICDSDSLSILPFIKERLRYNLIDWPRECNNR